MMNADILDPSKTPSVVGDENAPENRHIRSFVRRQGRISSAQTRYFDEMMQKIGLAYAPRRVDLDEVFGRHAPKILEIGFGMGEATALIAAANASSDYLGVEVHTPGVGSLCKRVAEKGITNLRIVRHDAFEVLRDMIAPGALSGIHIFFPDPWPKARHHKRRLIQPPLAAMLTDRLEPGGYVHCATDWEDYAEQMLAVFSAERLLRNTADADAKGFAPRPDYRPLTKFETRGLSLGYGVWDVVFRRVRAQS
ncbi:MAG: tRNA (guanosine(46)-N7)-methyltransferase TrmB [Candidatus Accumulibacter sp.]|jgi:tRNA (guanine-N7-)-methyltransferase|nr:tRNA (guanosine(46)-N7)-methyltransferase TrmB [Accumulibacter sp.]